MFPFTKTIHILGYPHLWTPPSAVLIFQRMMAQRDQHAPRARAASRGPGPRIQELWGSLDDAGTGFTTCVGKSWYIIMVSIHIYIYIHTYMHTYIYIHTYIHRFIHSYIHTFIHSYIHTYLLVKILHGSNFHSLKLWVGLPRTHTIGRFDCNTIYFWRSIDVFWSITSITIWVSFCPSKSTQTWEWVRIYDTMFGDEHPFASICKLFWCSRD